MPYEHKRGRARKEGEIAEPWPSDRLQVVAYAALIESATGQAIPKGRVRYHADKVAVRVTNRGTHQGELMGIPPTGRQVTITGITINRLSGGKIEEQWNNFDQLGVLRQLGVAPAPGQ